MSPIDYANYPANWFTEIRPRILARADNRCEVCGVPNLVRIVREGETWREVEGMEAEVAFLDGLRVVRVILTIAHLDHDLGNNHDSNLKALCQLHHLRHDGKHHAKNAAETRRQQRIERGQASLPLMEVHHGG